jgi:hypothetical protein
MVRVMDANHGGVGVGRRIPQTPRSCGSLNTGDVGGKPHTQAAYPYGVHESMESNHDL